MFFITVLTIGIVIFIIVGVVVKQQYAAGFAIRITVIVAMAAQGSFTITPSIRMPDSFAAAGADIGSFV